MDSDIKPGLADNEKENTDDIEHQKRSWTRSIIEFTGTPRKCELYKWKIRPWRIIILILTLVLLTIFCSKDTSFFHEEFFRWRIQDLNPDALIVWKNHTGLFLVLNTLIFIQFECLDWIGFSVLGYNKAEYNGPIWLQRFAPNMLEKYSLDIKMGWFVFYAPAAFLSYMCLLYCCIDQSSSNGYQTTGSGVLCAFLMFLHMIKRVLEEQYAQHRRKSIRLESWFNVGLGYAMIAWTTCKSAYELNRGFDHPWSIIGINLWTFGCFGNAYCHLLLAKVERPLLQDGSRAHVNMENVSVLWKYFYKPNMVFDFIQWIGFLVLSGEPSLLSYNIFFLFMSGMIGL